MYITDAYARIQCKECGNKLADELKPGQPFEALKTCPCQVQKRTKRKVKDAGLRTDKQ